MGVDTVSTPAGKQDRPFANPGILRAFPGVALPAPGPPLSPVREVKGGLVGSPLPVLHPVMGIPVPVAGNFLDLGGRVRQDPEPPERPLVLGAKPELAGNGEREGKSAERFDLVREFLLKNEILARAVPDLPEFYGHHDRVAVHQAVKGQ